MLTTMYMLRFCASAIKLFVTTGVMHLRRLSLLCRVWRLSKEAFSWSAMTSI